MTDTVTIETWETHELSLAAYLALEMECDPEYVWEGDQCYFVFPRSERLLNEVVSFLGGEADVEPREYFMKAADVKKAMFRAKARVARR